MSDAKFDINGFDRTTFAPIELFDQRSSEWKDVRLSFNAWERLQEMCGGDSLDGYYLNGYGVEGLIKACRLHAGLDSYADGIEYDSEGDTCYIHFSRLEDAVQTAQLASAMLNNKQTVVEMIKIARDNGFED
jgi:hypothetical protein